MPSLPIVFLGGKLKQGKGRIAGTMDTYMDTNEKEATASMP